MDNLTKFIRYSKISLDATLYQCGKGPPPLIADLEELRDSIGFDCDEKDCMTCKQRRKSIQETIDKIKKTNN